MKSPKKMFGSSIFLVVLFGCKLLSAQTSDNFSIKTSKISGGAAPQQSSDNFQAASTVGQQTSSPKLEDTQFAMVSGFLGVRQQLVTSVEPDAGRFIPGTFELFQNYPNPFNPETMIVFHLPEDADVLLTVHNIMGQQVRVLNDEPREAGAYAVVWDGADDLGARVVSGLYFYRIQAGEFLRTRKMLFVK